MLLILTQLTSFSPLIDYLIYVYLNKTQYSTIVFRFKNEESCVSKSFFSFLYYYSNKQDEFQEFFAENYETVIHLINGEMFCCSALLNFF
jgi:hypothetical protein